jgi:hypothetical protein
LEEEERKAGAYEDVAKKVKVSIWHKRPDFMSPPHPLLP